MLSWHFPCRPSLQRGQPKPRPLSRLSREVSAEETCLVKHAREYAADLAGQAGTAGVLHAASEKLHQENIRTYLAPQHHQVPSPSSPDSLPCSYTEHYRDTLVLPSIAASDAWLLAVFYARLSNKLLQMAGRVGRRSFDSVG